jgi:hypothetical protein
LHAVKKLELDKKVLIGKTNVLVGFVRLLILEDFWIWSNITLLVIYLFFWVVGEPQDEASSIAF